jgi:hypothetical protein
LVVRDRDTRIAVPSAWSIITGDHLAAGIEDVFHGSRQVVPAVKLTWGKSRELDVAWECDLIPNGI